MSSNRKLFGRAQIVINGQFYDSLPGAQLEVGGLRNVTRPLTNSIKYSQNLQPSKVTCAVPVTKDTSILALLQMTEAEIHFVTDVGRSYIIRNGAQVGAGAVADGDSGGTLPLEFNGDPAEEVVDG
jgi:hypothetical protein